MFKGVTSKHFWRFFTVISLPPTSQSIFLPRTQHDLPFLHFASRQSSAFDGGGGGDGGDGGTAGGGDGGILGVGVMAEALNLSAGFFFSRFSCHFLLMLSLFAS